MTSTKQEVPKELPEVIVDVNSRRKYQRGKFLGKGGFARCYELIDMTSRKVYAGKIVPKSLLVKPHQREKMCQEINIHRGLHNQHIVGFWSNFEDKDNVYIILELCRRRSLMELHKRRRAISEPEARYFLKQLLMGVVHLHKNKIIHRDLKLGNLFINDDMELKIGDFGLATVFSGSRKMTLCGTPNYIAPEILSKEGHSYEVDVWSIGCILYTLLVGKPPFETQSLKDTYSRIKKNEYSIPSKVGPLAKILIGKLLQKNPSNRPTVAQILEDDFMTKGYLPKRLPTSCLTTAPRFDAHPNSSIIALRKPLGEINAKGPSPLKSVNKNLDEVSTKPTVNGKKDINEQNDIQEMNADQLQEVHLRDLYKQVSELLTTNPDRKSVKNEDEAEDPSGVPMIWISKWVDYSDKYGLGYQLSDDSIGVFFNDFTKILLLADGENFHYIERNGKEHYHCLKQQPKELYKKVTLLCYFQSYMNEHLLKAGASMVPRDGDELARLPSLLTYFRTRSAIILLLSNGTFQINFFEDHVKLILCPLMGAVTFIDAKRNFRTYRFSLLAEHGCSDDLAVRLRYAKSMIQRLIMTQKSGYSNVQSTKSSASNSDSQKCMKRVAA